MTFHRNNEKKQCPTCNKHISGTNFSKHVAKCHNLTKNELCTAAWEKAADMLRGACNSRVAVRFREPIQEQAILNHIRSVIIPFIEKKAKQIEGRRHEDRE